MQSAASSTSKTNVPRYAIQALSISQFVFSSTNGLTLIAAILLALAEYASSEIDASSLWWLAPLGLAMIVTTVASFYRVVRTNELGATIQLWRGLSSRKYKVLRKGMSEMTLKASRLLPGDLVVLEKGDRVPADMQMVSGSLKVDEGSEIVAKIAATRSSLASKDYGLETFLFKGSNVVDGSATGLVIFAGDHGPGGDHQETTLQRDLKYFYKRMLVISITVAIVFGLIGQWAARGNDAQYALSDKASIVLVIVGGIIISSVPLLFTLSLVTGLGITERFIRRKRGLFTCQLDMLTSISSIGCLVIGSTDFILSGNSRSIIGISDSGDRDHLVEAIRMTLGAHDPSVAFWLDVNEAPGSPKMLDQKNFPIQIDRSAMTIKRGGVREFMCGPVNDMRSLCGLEPEPVTDPEILEIGFVEKDSFLGKISFSKNFTNQETKRAIEILSLMGIELIPVLHSRNMFMSSRDEVRSILESIGLTEEVSEITSDENPSQVAVEDVIEYDAEGYMQNVDEDDDCLVPDSVLEMIRSGMHAPAARRPIKKLVEGRQLALYPSHNLKRILHEDSMGFFNLNLIQKLRIVISLKHARPMSTVGYLGSSEVDRMSLLAAHIGITNEVHLGRSSDVLIADVAENSFPVLAKSILDCRIAFCNIRRSLMFLVSQIVPRICPLLLTLAFGYPLAISVTLIIASSMVLDLPLALALLKDPAEYDVPLRKPRSQFHEKLVSRRMILVAICFLGVLSTLSGFLGYCQVFSDFGYNPDGLAGIQNAGFVVFNQTTYSIEPGFPPTSGFPLELSLSKLDNVHLCGRVGNPLAFTTEALADVSYADRCTGPLFTLDKYNQFCYGSKAAEYTSTIQNEVALFVQQKSVAGVLFERNTTAQGVPVCRLKTSDGIYIPYGFYTEYNQGVIDTALQGHKCQTTDITDEADGLPICFTNRVIMYAQSAYLTSFVFFSVCSALLLLRTELFSFFHIGFVNRNWWVLLGCLASLGLTLAAVYVKPIQDLLNTRKVELPNLFSPAVMFLIFAFIVDEIRKATIRRQTQFGHRLMQRTMW